MIDVSLVRQFLPAGSTIETPASKYNTLFGGVNQEASEENARVEVESYLNSFKPQIDDI